LDIPVNGNADRIFVRYGLPIKNRNIITVGGERER
jgi:hypothetical protein